MSVLIKDNGEVKEGKVKEIYPEDLDIELLDSTIVRRKWWEIRKVEVKNE